MTSIDLDFEARKRGETKIGLTGDEVPEALCMGATLVHHPVFLLRITGGRLEKARPGEKFSHCSPFEMLCQRDHQEYHVVEYNPEPTKLSSVMARFMVDQGYTVRAWDGEGSGGFLIPSSEGVDILITEPGDYDFFAVPEH